MMEKYNVGDVWWTCFPFEECDEEKHRPAIVIDEQNIAVLAMYVTSKNKSNPFSIEITDWKAAGLQIPSWARMDRIIRIDEQRMDRKIGSLSEGDKIKILQFVAEKITGTVHEFSLVTVKNKEN